MSHLEERKEKICLNCKANLIGRYCHVCGQENLEPKETVWHLVNHFFQDVTHFDGKFFSTVKYLLTKPGFLSLEYMNGRRASYLNPIRMYVFTSAIFFLILFSTPGTENFMKLNENPEQAKEKAEGVKDWQRQITKTQSQIKTARDQKEDTTELVDELKALNEKITAAKKIYGDTTTRKFDNKDVALMMLRFNMDSLRKGMPDSITNKLSGALEKHDSQKRNKGDVDDMFGVSEKKYPTPVFYDSVQNSLPSNQRDGWMKRVFTKKIIEIRNEINRDKNSYFEHFKEKFFHSFPKILFISLPFFALILKLVYIRRKQYYYTSHGIFTIHLYCAIFILLLAALLINQLQDLAPWKWLTVILTIINVGVWLYMFIYLYKAMRKFYGQKRFKTFVKYVIVNLLALIINVFLMLLFILISAISI
ncbi:MAG TPA: DUF3667 domain-containing protein [Puia sp.]|nr:DUF3667 domain-containing protein [Puia sp.]